MAKFKCKVCGEIFEAPSAAEAVCPRCKAKGDKLEEIKTEAKNPYAGTQTEKNLEAAFAGESQARNKYTYYSSVAKKEGYEQMARTSSGPICTRASQRPPRRKASPCLRQSSAWLRQ